MFPARWPHQIRSPWVQRRRSKRGPSMECFGPLRLIPCAQHALHEGILTLPLHYIMSLIRHVFNDCSTYCLSACRRLSFSSFLFFPPFGRISFYISIVTLVPKRIWLSIDRGSTLLLSDPIFLDQSISISLFLCLFHYRLSLLALKFLTDIRRLSRPLGMIHGCE